MSLSNLGAGRSGQRMNEQPLEAESQQLPEAAVDVTIELNRIEGSSSSSRPPSAAGPFGADHNLGPADHRKRQLTSTRLLITMQQFVVVAAAVVIKRVASISGLLLLLIETKTAVMRCKQIAQVAVGRSSLESASCSDLVGGIAAAHWK